MEIQELHEDGTWPNAHSQHPGSEKRRQQPQMFAFIINKGADPKLSETHQQVQS